jgi:hypothetical protein
MQVSWCAFWCDKGADVLEGGATSQTTVEIGPHNQGRQHPAWPGATVNADQ